VQAVTETIVNAVVHRDYLSTGSVQVMLFKDRLEVWNPGRLPKGMTVEKLNGEHASLFPELRFSPVLKDRVLIEIISPSGTGAAPSRFRRWRTNAWKHRLCYRESLWSAFWSRAWNHLLKPRSI